MKKNISLIFIVISLTSFSFFTYAQLFANGVPVYFSNHGPGAAGVYANGTMIRFLNTTNNMIQCGVTQTATGLWKATVWLKPNHYASLDLPSGHYTWSCSY
ncbi:hypothetical protein J3L16_11015 [Alteromonas sp. 5E99-2]|uniref:hypothetical protein n=1 Tax=Alteromonas sp. 5E99-2 TaxID=2817683 RepID=UPI001A99C5C5|nr:hypothetical protein [Alteromonas sp. 5E99-2]MBO1256210.1 hypothetical protein [Alteromonas sp. 5E99-2]